MKQKLKRAKELLEIYRKDWQFCIGKYREDEKYERFHKQVKVVNHLELLVIESEAGDENPILYR